MSFVEFFRHIHSGDCTLLRRCVLVVSGLVFTLGVLYRWGVVLLSEFVEAGVIMYF